MQDVLQVDDIVLLWEQLRSEGRETSIVELCDSRPDLVEEVREALACRTQGEVSEEAPAQTLLDPPEVSAPAEALYALLRPAVEPGELGWIGEYRVLRLIGAGGMGAVFQAVDTRLGRSVALKTLRPSLVDSVGARRRFLQEARAAASIEHEHVVTIYQVGEDRGTPYLAMHYLHGQTLDQRLRSGPPLELHEILRIGREVAEGLVAAHQHGLIHRDIKPGNIWLEDPHGRVKILDFGLAYVAERAEDVHITASGMILGTPAYMAPEQAAAERVDERCDLFSLGVVLYQTLTNCLPFAGKNSVELLASLVRDDAPPLRSLRPDVRPELDGLVGRLLAKPRADRPASAAEVVADIRAIERTVMESGHPGPSGSHATAADSEARRKAGSSPSKVQRLVRHRWAALGLAAGLGGVAIGLVAALGPVAVRTSEEQGELRIEANAPGDRVAVFRGGELVAIADGANGRVVRLKEGRYELKLIDPKPGVALGTRTFTVRRGTRAVVRVESDPSATGPDTADPTRRAVEFATGSTNPAEPSAGGRDTLFPGLVPRPAKLPGVSRWQVVTRAPLYIQSVAWAPDGKRLAVGAMDGVIRVYSGDGLDLTHVLPASDWPVYSVAWSPDGGTLVSAGGEDHRVRLWDVGKGVPRALLEGHTSTVLGVAFRGDGRLVASASADWTVRLWYADDGSPGPVLTHGGAVRDLTFSPDGRSILTACDDGICYLWDVRTRRVTREHRGHVGPVQAVAWDRAGDVIASGGSDGVVRLWDARSGAERLRLDGLGQPIRSLAFNPDGQTLATATAEVTRFWSVADGTPRTDVPLAGGELCYRPDGRELAVASERSRLILWDVPAETAREKLACEVMPLTALALSPDGGRVALGLDSGVLQLRRTDGRATVLRARDKVRGHVAALAWSPDQRSIAAGSSDAGVRLWNADEGTVVLDIPGHPSAVGAIAYSRQGKWLATGSADKSIRLWNLVERTAGPLLTGHESDVSALAFGPNDDALISVGLDQTTRLWDVPGGKEVKAARTGGKGWPGVAFDPAGGGRVFSFDEGGFRVAAVSDLAWKQRFTSEPILRAAVAPGGRTAYVLYWSGLLERWDEGHGKAKWSTPAHGPNCGLGLALASGGRLVMSCGRDGTLRTWEPESGACAGVVLALTEDREATISPVGRMAVNHETVDTQLVYVVQTEVGGPIETLTPGAFRERFERALKP